ncbi:MAG: TonB-dependent receptor [Ferruginibacter sp.]|nr:TonB-dependent receptor [Ferruginibacter sp.]
MNNSLFIMFFFFLSITKAQAQGEQLSDTAALPELMVRSYELMIKEREVPASIAILSRASINRTTDASFLAAMNSIAGVKMDERSPGSVRLSIRGNILRSPFGVRNVKVYWDGVPFTDANGNTYLNQIGFDLVGKMEVLKGPGGSMYGAGTGGVLLISSREIPEGKRTFQLHSSVGSDGLFYAAGRATFSHANANNSVSYSHQQSNGYRKQSELNRDVVNYRGAFDVNKNQSISANIFYSNLYYQTPGGLTASEVLANPRQARPGAENNKAALYLKTLYSAISTEIKLNHSFSHITGIYISHTDFKNPTTRNYELKTELGGGGRSVLQYHHGIWQLVGGGEYQYTFNNTGIYGNRNGKRDSLQYQDEIGSRVWNVFVQTTADIKRFKLIGGLSLNNYHYGLTRVSTPGTPNESSNFKPRVIPRFALLYRLNKQFNLFASVADGFSPPSIDEVHATDGVFNSALRADEGRSFEIGLKGFSLSNRWWGTISGYYFRLNETIVSRRDSSGGDYFINAGRTDQLGLEAAIQYKLISKQSGVWREVNLRSSLTLLHARFKDYQQGQNIFNDNKLTGTPSRMFTFGADFKILNHFYFQTSFSYTGAIPLNDANTVFSEAYSQSFVKAEYKLGSPERKAVSIFFAYEKTFTSPYSLGPDLNAVGNRFFNPSPPQRFMTGVNLYGVW